MSSSDDIVDRKQEWWSMDTVQRATYVDDYSARIKRHWRFLYRWTLTHNGSRGLLAAGWSLTGSTARARLTDACERENVWRSEHAPAGASRGAHSKGCWETTDEQQ